MSIGGGHASLEESMAVLGVPTMTKRSFIAAEKRIGAWWTTHLEESMKLAGQEEREKAIARKFQGDPAITVISLPQTFVQCKMWCWDHYWIRNKKNIVYGSKEQILCCL